MAMSALDLRNFFWGPSCGSNSGASGCAAAALAGTAFLAVVRDVVAGEDDWLGVWLNSSFASGMVGLPKCWAMTFAHKLVRNDILPFVIASRAWRSHQARVAVSASARATAKSG